MTQFVNNDVSSGAVIFASDHNTQGSLIAAVINGGIDNDNISSSAAIDGSKLADATITGTKLASYKVQRQNDSTNITESTSIFQSGWGYIANNTGANNITETVTFPTAYSSPPIVLVSFAGDHLSSSNIGDAANNISGRVSIKGHTVTNTNFIVQIHNGGGANFSAGNSFYRWIALGT